MLERLLLQPETSCLFEHDTWKYIVLDEAHCYNGSLGTEIAWLVRRLLNRVGNSDNVRFMATSATLIDDPNATQEEKISRIQEKFAAKIFPATPNSFSVQFGNSLAYTPPMGAYGEETRHGRLYLDLFRRVISEEQNTALRECLTGFDHILSENEWCLFALTQKLMGAESWLKRLRPAAGLSEHAGGPVAIGDALYICIAIRDVVQAELIPLENIGNLEAGMFSQDSLTKLQLLINFVINGYGNLGDWDKWRDHLHDHADPRPSSIEGDTYEVTINGQVIQRQNRYGNRLHLLQKWRAVKDGSLSGLTIEDLTYLLKTASALANSDELAEYSMKPLAVEVKFSETARNMINAFLENYSDLGRRVAAAQEYISGLWRNVLRNFAGGNEPRGAGVPELLAWFLGNDEQVCKLSDQLRYAMENPVENGQHARFDAVAKEIFGEEDEAKEYLNALVSLCLLAKNPDNNRPLIDIRYHQLIRGLKSVGLSFRDDGSFTLHTSEAMSDGEDNAIFNLGACRACGQPFIIGYMKAERVDQGTGKPLLSRLKTGEAKYLHAIAWEKGAEYEDEEQKEQGKIWYNIKTGEVTCLDPGAAEGWRPGYWYVPPAADGSEFLAECPCCRAKQHNQSDTRYGIITPYEVIGEQFKLTLLDELIRQTDASTDPSARRHPGAGRKLLAFSDSRRAAAGLSYRYRELFRDVAVGRFLTTVIEEDRIREYHEQNILRENPLFNNPPPEMREAVLLWVTQQVEERLAAPLDTSVRGHFLKERLQEENCHRLLEICGEDGTDLPEQEAAKILLIQAIRKRGRYSLFRRGLLRLESRAINRKLRLGRPEGFPAEIEDEKLRELCNDILLYLFERAIIQGTTVNLQYIHKYVRRNTMGEDSFKFVSNHSKSGLNRLVREHLNYDKDQAKDILDLLWPWFTNDSVLRSVDTNGNYAYSIDDIIIRDSEERNTNPFPYEEHERYIAERDIIPVRSEEHTAQVANQRGAAYQRAFADGMINILSCSTTFEMGIDLGDLACVFLSNLPPSAANYRQRAGRAGRRPGSAAYVLSFVGDSPHEQYYFNKPTELLFGRMKPPVIYLENPVFRARHLRAEALHKFLEWLKIDNRNSVISTWTPQGGAVSIRRKWELAGNFFIGLRCNSFARRGTGNITAVYPPIVDSLEEWGHVEQDNVQQYAERIKDVGELDYSVISDLIWQLTGNPDAAPYPLDEAGKYADLAGPHQPGAGDDQFKREVQYRIKILFEKSGTCNWNDTPPVTNINKIQIHLLNESTITWLTRNRVLPKYGFPVDVIRLQPAPEDMYGKDVELERDRRIGLYEYAPGQKVMADGRIYESANVLVYLPGGVENAEAGNRNFYLCFDCHQPHAATPSGNRCTACGGTVNPLAQQAIQPDAFRANTSKAGNAGISPERGTPLKIFSGGSQGEIAMPESGVITAESTTGELLYFNFGPGYQGFSQIHGTSLCHSVKTDIAIWIPSARLFQENPAFQGDRLAGSMQSALAAILTATALELGIAENEISGITYPQEAGTLCFVLFDEASGGGGAARQLILSGTNDEETVALIRRILERALDLCLNCPECGDLDLTRRPVDIRERQSCYKCLRTYANQRLHHILDRGEAALVIEALLAPVLPLERPECDTVEATDEDRRNLTGITFIVDGRPVRVRRVDDHTARILGPVSREIPVVELLLKLRAE